MGQTIQSGNTSVNGSVTTTVSGLGLNTVGAGQTIVNKCFSGAGSSQNVYTVTAGKTFYLHGALLSMSGANGDMIVYLNDGTTKCWDVIGISNIPTSINGDLGVYTAGQNVKVNASNGHRAQIWGVEQ